MAAFHIALDFFSPVTLVYDTVRDSEDCNAILPVRIDDQKTILGRNELLVESHINLLSAAIKHNERPELVHFAIISVKEV